MSSARPDKSQCSEFRLHFNEQSFGVCRQLLSSPSPHPGSLACCQLLSISDPLLEPACGAHMVTGHAAAGDAWLCSPGRESVWTHGPVHHHVGKREFICFLGIILAWAWDRPGAILKEPINFPSFHRPWMGFYLSPGSADRTLWSSTFPCAPQQSGTGWWKEEC